ncbi:hypothetical protein SPBR_07280 [Sporothrix brasiliensis 5110]|uniref:Uncharacterized protein n=1 Tax=Sporothrix brasiliensis 5110 TaxID=1398154 RepID=A0A0C2IRA4_9PEZI|nr:uncharacterized protein SPBR_07280 [Sporothrix brasiliensis 5110]KIH89420.1 hypothetical protein SPBR_07280 [Sporothrix brasiliensis 5110]
MVKPILKKRSHSEKNSLDLDRPLEEQHVPGLAGLVSGYESGGQMRGARDISFSFNDSSAFASKPRYQHGRSHSGTSHVSIATTASGGGARAGSFVHPFQQTPRTQTPPLTYTNSLASVDNIGTGYNNTGTNSIRDYSPTITENDDDDDFPVGSLPNHRYNNGHTASLSQSSLRHPSLANQRAASFSDINAAPPLRVNTAARSMPSGRRGPGNSSLSTSLSHSDLHLHAFAESAVMDSPLSVGPAAPAPLSSSSYIPISPLRSSLEGVAFPRLRSRSELDSGARADQIREARRKFEERERAKAEKHDREMLRKRERRDHKEAKSYERQAAQVRKNSAGAVSDVVRPSLSRKSTPTFGSNSGSGSGSGSGEHERGRDSGRYSRQAAHEITEKPLAFKSNNYENVAGGMTPSFGPTVDSVAFKNARRNNTTKRKTQGYWNGFVLWLRTRIFRMGRN